MGDGVIQATRAMPGAYLAKRSKVGMLKPDRKSPLAASDDSPYQDVVNSA